MYKKQDHEIVYEYVKTQNEWVVKANNPYYKTTRLAQKSAKLEHELLERGLLTEEEIKSINS